ncbi:SGNH/GDSL hydrolase family protein [Paenibacillus sp. PR3]|uniref:SGNH/GDSL hydrolase family protein n=1 Tax=Paenibacillus terricola TaxID=2763503 RepID=A0ABR8MRN5_9BACL|nr:SGNH/GDSL hydrolase family protein [Paenibacillus terricola]MBD3917926.1 SGNH/GDSL hydrolase family protein [Paenibacillus terricola]
MSDNKSKLTILFQGDSITDGNRGRSEDPNHIHGHGYVYLIASRIGAAYAEHGITFINRGVSGDRAVDLYARWETDALAYRPQMISILVGINDILRGIGEGEANFDRYERSLRRLLEEARENDPSVTLVVCEPFALRTGMTAERWEQDWEPRLIEKQRVARAIAEEYDAIFVPLQSVFNEASNRADASYWMWDGVHPTTAGHTLLAEQWLSAVNFEQWLRERL